MAAFGVDGKDLALRERWQCEALTERVILPQYTIKNHTKKARQMFLRIYRATKMAYEISGSPYLVTSISQLVP